MYSLGDRELTASGFQDVGFGLRSVEEGELHGKSKNLVCGLDIRNHARCQGNADIERYIPRKLQLRWAGRVGLESRLRILRFRLQAWGSPSTRCLVDDVNGPQRQAVVQEAAVISAHLQNNPHRLLRACGYLFVYAQKP